MSVRGDSCTLTHLFFGEVRRYSLARLHGKEVGLLCSQGDLHGSSMCRVRGYARGSAGDRIPQL